MFLMYKRIKHILQVILLLKKKKKRLSSRIFKNCVAIGRVLSVSALCIGAVQLAWAPPEVVMSPPSL